MKAWTRRATPTAVLLTWIVAGCGDATEPATTDFQVIEDLTFAASLNIDLTAFERLNTGVYIQDIEPGEGETLVWGDRPTVRYTGWLADGLQFDSGELAFLMGNNQVVPGFEQGTFGMRLGGVRRMIIPPILAYGDRTTGNIPAGSVLIFEVEVTAVTPAPSG